MTELKIIINVGKVEVNFAGEIFANISVTYPSVSGKEKRATGYYNITELIKRDNDSTD